MFDRMKMKLANNLGNFLSTTPPSLWNTCLLLWRLIWITGQLGIERRSSASLTKENPPHRRIFTKLQQSCQCPKKFSRYWRCVFFVFEDTCFLLRICVFFICFFFIEGACFFYWGCVFLSNWFECFFVLYLINSLSLCKNKHVRNGRKQHRHQRINYALQFLHRSIVFLFVGYWRRKKLKWWISCAWCRSGQNVKLNSKLNSRCLHCPSYIWDVGQI